MSRLAVLAFTLTALPWSGESFIATISSSPKTCGTAREGEPHHYRCHKPGKRRARHHTRRQLHYQREEPEHDDSRTAFSSPSISSIISYKRSSSLLRAALITDPSPNGGDKKGPGWHRRILGKISRRRGSKSSSSLPSSSIEQEEAQDSLVDTFLVYEQEDDEDFVVRNFDLMVPDSVLPVVQMDEEKSSLAPRIHSPEDFQEHRESNPPVIDSEYFDVAITPAIPNNAEVTKGTASATSAASLARSQTKRGVVCRMLENILLERLGERWPIEAPKNLKVDVCESTDSYNNVLRLLFRGLFRADATLSSERIVFPTIRFSSIKLQMERVTLNLVGFFQDKSKDDIDVHHGPNPEIQGQGNRPVYAASTKTTGKPRYPEQFDVHIEDITMSRHDLLFSSSIKNGLRQLLINVLKDRGIRSDSIVITDIDILRNGKISCIGEAKTHFPSAPPVRFEVRSRISFSNRGHVLTFPGLEVSLNRDIGLFVPIHPTLDLDVGHNTKFHSIVIDGRKKRVKIAASVTITPERTRRTQDYVQTSDAFSAIFFYDVGKWLTRLGRFSK